MDQKHAKKPVPRGGPGSASPSQGEAPPASKKNDAAAPEPPEDYSDPVCVCEPEPYWQEIAERLQRDS
jgi:hypothetical protein